MDLSSDILKDFDEFRTFIKVLVVENRALQQKLIWTKQCFKQALEILGEEGDSRVEYLEHMFLNFFEE